MKKYIIRTGTGEEFNAASKARRDAEAIALQAEYEVFCFQGKRTADGSVFGAVRLAWDGLKNWNTLIRTAEEGSTILIQYPHYPMKSALLAKRMIPKAQRNKGLRFIALVHDLDSIRGLHGKAAVYSDEKVLPLFDAIICHNERMKRYLMDKGIPETKLIVLGIFDYLTKEKTTIHQLSDGIAVAGNLSPEKCGYVQELIQQKELTLHLYGKGLEETELPDWVHAYGSVAPDELPGKLRGAFGLVWDGPEADTCAGKNGNYLRYNNPHKLSLYLSAGMPVMIWKEAAEAAFVKEHHLGLTVSSLTEIRTTAETVSEDEYHLMSESARQTGTLLKQGAFLRKALDKAEETVKA